MSTTKATLTLKFLSQEILTEAEAPAANNEQQRTLNTGKQALSSVLDSTTTPKLDKPIIAREITLPAGVTTIDLTAAAAFVFPAGGTRTFDFTGAKLRAWYFRAATTNNAAGITIAAGAANPYPLFGTGKSIIIGPGRVECGTFAGVNGDLPAVAAGVKTIDITAANNDKLYMELLFGT